MIIETYRGSFAGQIEPDPTGCGFLGIPPYPAKQRWFCTFEEAEDWLLLKANLQEEEV